MAHGVPHLDQGLRPDFLPGVVNGILMSFQFHASWPGFMERTGNVAGPLLGYEVLTACLLEATFLGIMLFGHGKVRRDTPDRQLPPGLGITMSALWIPALNSHMQSPAGVGLHNGEFFVVSWLDVDFNPSFPYRSLRTLLACGLTVVWSPACRPGNCSCARLMQA